MKEDGHCTYSPDKQWILVDTYPDKDRMQHLRLYRPSDGKPVLLGSVSPAALLRGRVALRPASALELDGRSVCIDSGHTAAGRCISWT
ncbi:hypothetical protein HS125_07880 [bacterium]|nr:hypothetical protein [bacterium]